MLGSSATYRHRIDLQRRLPDADQHALPFLAAGANAFDDDLLDEIRRARAVTQQIARKRQVQFLAKQLRRLDDEELEPIRAKLENDRQFARMEAAALHHAEKWRDRLIDEGDDALTAFFEEHSSADGQQLRQLARQAKTEREQNRPPHAQPELFRVLRELLGAH